MTTSRVRPANCSIQPEAVRNAPWPYPLWIAHRGGGLAAPENTLAAIRAGAAAGFGMVEFDVMLSRDDVPVLIHDETLERTTDGSGAVSAYDLAGLQRLDAGRWHSPACAGERIPTLEQALDCLLELGLAANIEIKPARGFESETGRIVGEMVRAMVARRWPADMSVPLLSSFSRDALVSARAVAPGLPRGLLFDTLPDDWAQQMAAFDARSIHCDAATLQAGQLAELVTAGVPVLCYTVNDADRARALIAAGVSGLFTDTLDFARQIPAALDVR
jgi:glycerophosphoryl diester phosphodiesterase